MSTTTSTTSSAAQSLITALGSGSGVDLQSLSQSLVNAEKVPRSDLINKKIDKCESRISGYGAINYILSDLQSKFAALNKQGDYASITASNSQSSAFSVTTTAEAAQASHAISVNRLASSQRSITATGYNSPASTLATGASVQITLAGQALPTVNVAANATVNQLASAINTQLASYGVKAQLVNKGAAAADPQNPYHLVISGPTGSSNSFSVSGLPMDTQSTTGFGSASANLSGPVSVSLGGNTITLNSSHSLGDLASQINTQFGGDGYSARVVNLGNGAKDPSLPCVLQISGPNGDASGLTFTGLGMGSATLQSAQDAVLNVDGVDIRSASNTVKDAIAGVTLNLSNATSGTASLDLSRDLSAIKTKINELVTSFNDVRTVLNSATSPDSKVEGYGASLVGDSTVGMIRNMVRSLFTSESSTPGSAIKSMRDLGVSIDRDGKMSVDDSKLTQALQNHFDDVVKMMSDSRNTPTLLNSVKSGIAGDAVKKLTDMLSSRSALNTQSTNAQKQISKYKDDLSKLDDRMSQLLNRYIQQFAAMDSLVGQINSQKSGLKSTFEGMANAYK